MNTRDEMNRGPEPIDRAGSVPLETTGPTREAMEAGPAGVVEREVTVTRVEREPRESRPEGREQTAEKMEKRSESATERVLHKAGDALQGAAPTLGRGAEKAVGAAGSALAAASGPLGTMVGKIAGRVGGWWNSASEAMAELPKEEKQACMVHFEAYEVRPTGMTFERALPGYTLGYVAARNPAYRGRAFDQIEPDLQHGLGTVSGAEYDALRDYSRYGYQRGIAGL